MATLPLEQWVDDVAPEVLAELRAAARRVTYQDGQLIHARGENRQGLSIVVTGAVRVGTTGVNGMFHSFGTLGPGGVFGEMSLFTGLGRLHDAYANGPTVIDQIAADHFAAIADKHPALLRALLKLISQRLHLAYERIDEAVRRPLIDRLGHHMLVLTQGRRGRTELAVGQAELAEAMGSSRVSVNKALRQLGGLGMIETGYHRIVICDRGNLRRWLESRAEVARLPRARM